MILSLYLLGGVALLLRSHMSPDPSISLREPTVALVAPAEPTETLTPTITLTPSPFPTLTPTATLFPTMTPRP